MVWSSLKILKDETQDLIMVDDFETIVVPIYLTKVKAKVVGQILAEDGSGVLVPHESDNTYLFNRKLSKQKVISLLIKMGYSKWEIESINYIQLKPQVKYSELVQSAQKEGYKYE